MWRAVESSGNLQRYLRTIDICVERKLLRRVRTRRFCSRRDQNCQKNNVVWQHLCFHRLWKVPRRAALQHRSSSLANQKIADHNCGDCHRTPSATIRGGTQAVPLIPLAYAEDVRRINEEIEEEENGPKPRKLIWMERLQARSVMAHDKKD